VLRILRAVNTSLSRADGPDARYGTSSGPTQAEPVHDGLPELFPEGEFFGGGIFRTGEFFGHTPVSGGGVFRTHTFFGGESLEEFFGHTQP
jgi:hypothetical protein